MVRSGPWGERGGMSVLWYTIPIAIALALSVVPIVVMLLLLLDPDPLPRSIPFAVGSMLGVAALVTAFALGASLLPSVSDDDFPPWTHIIEIAIGVALFVTGLVLVFRKPGPPKNDDTSKLTTLTRGLTPVRALGFGMLMNLRPKCIVLTIAAGLAIGTAPIDPILGGFAVLLFAVISGAALGGLVIAYAIGKERVRSMLERLRTWLTAHSGVVLRVLLLGLGVILVVVGTLQLTVA